MWARSAPRRRRARGSDQRHAELLGARGQRVRLDPVGHELGVPGHRHDAQLRGRREQRELAEEIERVRLVSRAPATEDVGIEHDSLHVSVRQRSTTASADLRHVKDRARSRPALDSSSRPRHRLRDASRERRDVGRVDEDGGPAGDLLEGRSARGHDRRPARHRLEHGQAEPFVQRRVDEAACAPVERGELGVRHLADPAHDVDPAPAARSDHAEVLAGCARRFDRAPQVLSRLERGDRENVVGGHARPVGREDVVDPVRNHGDALGRDAGELDRLVARELRDRDDRIGRTQYAPEAGAPVEAVPARERLGRAQDREVVHRQNRRHGRTRRAAKGRAVQEFDAC